MSIVIGREDIFNLKSSLYDRVNPRESEAEGGFCCRVGPLDVEHDAAEGPADDEEPANSERVDDETGGGS